MQKVRNVSRVMVFLLITLWSVTLFSQKISGKYYLTDTGGEHWMSLDFLKNNVFDYQSGMDLGTERYGQGHYVLTKDSLILNFDLTELNEGIYHKYTFYENYKDSVEIKFNIITTDGSIAKGLNVGSLTDSKVIVIEDSNEGVLKLKRENRQKELLVSSLEYNSYSFPFYGAYNYNFTIYLTDKNQSEKGWLPIKFIIWKYKIKKIRNDFIELQTASGEILKLRRAKEDNIDDPFK